MSSKRGTYDDRPARKISSVLSKFVAMTALQDTIQQVSPRSVLSQQIIVRNSPRVHHLPLDPVVVPYTLDGRVKRLSTLQVQPNSVTLLGLFLQRNDRILYVETTVGSERLRDDQQSLGESGHTELLSTLGLGLCLLVQVLSACNLERTGSRDKRLVLDGVLDGTESISDSIGDLGDGVSVGSCKANRTSDQQMSSRQWSHRTSSRLTLDQQRHTLGLPDLFHKRVLFLS